MKLFRWIEKVNELGTKYYVSFISGFLILKHKRIKNSFVSLKNLQFPTLEA